MKYFTGSIIFTIVGLIAAFGIGYSMGGFTLAVSYAFITLMLGMLETSFSFDNAVVNAKILQDMPPFWRYGFLYLG